MALDDDRKKFAALAMTGSPISILGAACKLLEIHGSPLERVIAKAIDASVESHLNAAAAALAQDRAGGK